MSDYEVIQAENLQKIYFDDSTKISKRYFAPRIKKPNTTNKHKPNENI